MTDLNISLRPVCEGDEVFLCELYFTTRQDEVADFGWDDQQVEAFLRMQFETQSRAYKMQSPDAEHFIIVADETPVGRMIVDRSDQHIVLMDIAVLPEFRGRSIATGLIKKLQDEAGLRIFNLHVNKANAKAIKLYERLGFSVSDDSAFVYEMKWQR